MKRHLFSLILVAMVAIIGFTALTPVEVEADPQSGTVYGAITTADRIHAYSFDGTTMQILGTAWVAYITQQDFHSAAFLPGVELYDGTRDLLVVWMSDPNPIYAGIKLYRANGTNGGTLMLPAGMNVTGAGNFSQIDDKLYAQISEGETTTYWVWQDGLDQAPTEVILDGSIETIRQRDFGYGFSLYGSGPDGRITLMSGNQIVYQQPSTDDFHSFRAVIMSDSSFGEVDGSIFRITHSGYQFNWVRPQNDVMQIGGSTILLAQTYDASGFGLVTYDANGVLIHESATVADMSQIDAAAGFGVIANGNVVEIIDLNDHEPMANYTTLQPVTHLQMAEEHVPPTPTSFNIYLPLLTSN